MHVELRHWFNSDKSYIRIFTFDNAISMGFQVFSHLFLNSYCHIITVSDLINLLIFFLINHQDNFETIKYFLLFFSLLLSFFLPLLFFCLLLFFTCISIERKKAIDINVGKFKLTCDSLVNHLLKHFTPKTPQTLSEKWLVVKVTLISQENIHYVILFQHNYFNPYR